MRTVFLTLKHFLPLSQLKGQPCVSPYRQHRGGVLHQSSVDLLSYPLFKLMQQIWAETRLLLLLVFCIPGQDTFPKCPWWLVVWLFYRPLNQCCVWSRSSGPMSTVRAYWTSPLLSSSSLVATKAIWSPSSTCALAIAQTNRECSLSCPPRL